MPKNFNFCTGNLPSVDAQGQRLHRIHGIDRAVVGSRHLFFSSDIEMARDFTTGALSLGEGEWISSGTLRNSLYLEPLAQLTKLRDLRLWIDYAGALNLKILCATAGKKAKVLKEVQLLSSERTQHLVELGSPVELPGNSRLFWNVEALEDDVCLHDLCYLTQSVPRADCRLMVLLRTYGRTADAKGILQRFAEAGQQDPYYGALLDHMHFFLLDTTPNCVEDYREPWQQDLNLEIVASKNLGGGGNAGHMLKLMDEDCRSSGHGPTELLILDDDLTISPESLARYFMFCAYRSQEVICSAPVLMKSRPSVVWEDGGFWGRLNFHEGGGFNNKRNLFPNLLKHGAQVDSFDGLDAFCALNPCEYSTFIFFGLPMSTFRKLGYPAAFFLRGDDIEYSLRAQEHDIPLITNPNIVVWHEPSHSYGQEYMAILHGVIINLTYSSQEAGFYLRYFEERLYEHASIDDLLGIGLYKDILAELINPGSRVLSLEFEQHYLEKLKNFGSVKMVKIQETGRGAFERQAADNNVLLVPFVYPGYHKDAPKSNSVVVYNHAAKSYREIPTPQSGQKTRLLKAYTELLIELEDRFDDIRQRWQQRLLATQGDEYWSAIGELHRGSTRVIFNAQKAPTANASRQPVPTVVEKPRREATNRKWLGRLRAAVDRSPTRSDPHSRTGKNLKPEGGPDVLPDDFDPAMYLHINPDVQNSGIEPADHFLRFGRKEGRRYKPRN